MTEKIAQNKLVRCEGCGLLFESEWSHEEAVAEYQKNFQQAPNMQDSAIVCDDCYNAFMRTLTN
jgi:hypothetical protein